MNVTPCHVVSRVTSRELSRIGHAMSTTPHHTNNYEPCGSHSFFSSARAARGHAGSSPMPRAATGVRS